MMIKIMFLIFGFILVIGLSACEIKTPEIHGIVLDAETKEPVEGAWISATIGVKTKTVGGDVGQMISLDPPHTRTDKEGKFLIPAKKINKAPLPISFGSEIDSFGIGAITIDDRRGGLALKGEELKDFLKKDTISIQIKIKYIERTEAEYFSHLQSLFNYCLTGRFGIEVPPVEGGCDEWELNFAIFKHEIYLEKHPITEKTRSHNSIILEQLGHLYEKKGEFEIAIKYLTKAKEIRYFRPQDLEHEIERIKKKLERGKK